MPAVPVKGRRGEASSRTRRCRKSKRVAPGALAIIDRLLLMPIRVTHDGGPAKIPAIEAIIRELLKEEAAGSTGASRVLRKYRRLVQRVDEQRPTAIFVENEYS
ncbi:MAG TPA: hypothetical protein VHC39_11535 [Rhizomicrobium sp.]|nr:hypothetical protein [Rhizomicrobium sp.]